MSANLIDAVNVHLSAASSAPDPVALLHLAQARALLVSLEESVSHARNALEAMEREQVRKASAVLAEGKPGRK